MEESALVYFEVSNLMTDSTSLLHAFTLDQIGKASKIEKTLN